MMAHAETTRHHGNRHGRSEQARLAVLEAADNLLVERGFADVTIEGIAARAGVAKQTIYRWWTSKTAILFDALSTDAAEYFTPADHADLGSDLRDQLRQLAAFLTTERSSAPWPGRPSTTRRSRPGSRPNSRHPSASATARPSAAPATAASWTRPRTSSWRSTSSSARSTTGC